MILNKGIFYITTSYYNRNAIDFVNSLRKKGVEFRHSDMQVRSNHKGK